ncbi:hypothetical protein [Xanthomonas hortorum]|uniref:Secretin/TonB short N-terminal domain-containing protein n=1 Tax=Xanthomonas hortorum pv. hederae TaxID=453603 RepID=A0A9X4HAB4_9XANT|nr:hypothetical protein [Xanthomonas hortorum]MCE4370402.1 hypothetical protein [Xanthomonas hortorum pv. hederae]MDC8640841.1 hypothetical protein [Xanthomonas hortorum pv. hederae]
MNQSASCSENLRGFDGEVRLAQDAQRERHAFDVDCCAPGMRVVAVRLVDATLQLFFSENFMIYKKRAHLLLSLLLIGAAGPAAANECGLDKPVRVDIPAQMIGSALKEWSRQTGCVVRLDPKITNPPRSQPVQGTLNTQESIYSLLAGAGLEATPTNDYSAGNVATLVFVVDDEQGRYFGERTERIESQITALEHKKKTDKRKLAAYRKKNLHVANTVSAEINRQSHLDAGTRITAVDQLNHIETGLKKMKAQAVASRR